MKKKTGIDLIMKERIEQINKHGFKLSDDQFYSKGQLVQAALHCLEKVKRGPGFTNVKHKWPDGWDAYFENKIRMKSDIGKLKVAGAFYWAENDRLGESKYEKEIDDIAARIDEQMLISTDYN